MLPNNIQFYIAYHVKRKISIGELLELVQLFVVWYVG